MKRQKQNKLVIGVTGSLGSGKSTVARMLKGSNCELLDADKIAHSLLSRKRGAYKKVVAVFGDKILSAGAVDRKKLGRIVFNDKKLLKKLEKILHPLVIRQLKERISRSPKRILIIDAPLLVEVRNKLSTDRLIVVGIRAEAQLRRLKLRDSLSAGEVRRRLKLQAPLSEKCARADFIIDNSGTLRETKKQVALIRRRLWKS